MAVHAQLQIPCVLTMFIEWPYVLLIRRRISNGFIKDASRRTSSKLLLIALISAGATAGYLISLLMDERPGQAS